MDFRKAFFSFGLILCGLSISPTVGLASSQNCASLFNAVNFTGDTLNLTEGSNFSNLENVTLGPFGTGWNATLSFQVEPGCIIFACNESFYKGECRNFSKGLTTLPEPFEDILSIRCSCPQTCDPPPPADRLLLVTQLFAKFMGEMTEESKKSGERIEKMLLSMQEYLEKSDEQRERKNMHDHQTQMQMEQGRMEERRRQEEREIMMMRQQMEERARLSSEMTRACRG